MVFSKVKQILASPIFEDEEKTRAAHLLNSILLATMLLNVVYNSILPIILPNPIPLLITGNILLLLQIGLLIFMRRGYVRETSILLVFIMWIYVTFIPYYFGGVRNPAFHGYIFLVLLAGLLLGGWGALSVAGLSIVSSLALLFAELNGNLPLSFVSLTPTYIWSGLFMVLMATAILLYLATNSMNTAPQRTQPSDVRYRSLFENTLDAILIANDEARYVDANPAACELLGYSRDELLGMSVWNITPSPDHSQTQQLWNDFLATGQMAGEYAVRCKDGSMRQTEFRAVANVLPGLHLSVLRDVTQRKQAAVELKRSHDLLEATQSIAQVGSWEFYPEREIGYWSAEMYRIYEVNPEGGVPSVEDFLMLVHPEDRPQVVQSQQHTLETQTPSEVEYRVQLPSGKTKFVLAQTLFIYDTEQGSPKLVGTIQDITERKQAELALRRSEAMLSAAFENLPFDFWAMDAHGRYILQNATSIKHWGYRIGLRTEELDLPEDILAQWQENNRRAFGGEIVTGEVSNTYNNEQRYYDKLIVPIREGKTITGILGMNIDITERKRAEKALRESEARFRAVFNDSALGIGLTDHEGRCFEVNPVLARILGYSREELLGKSFADVTHPDDVAADINLYRELMAGKRDHYQLNKRYFRKDGQLVWGHLTVSLIRDAEGNPQFAVGMLEDITEQKTAEQQVQEQQQLIQKVFDTNPNVLYVFDLLEQRPIFQNQYVATTIGYSKAQLLEMGSMTLQELMHPDDLPRLSAHFEKLKHAGDDDIYSFEYRMRHANGEWRWFYSLDTVFSRGNDGLVQQIIGTATDITERKQAEEVLQQYTKRLETLRQIDQAILASRLPEEIAQTALHHLQQLVPCYGTGVMLFDLDQNQATLLAVHINDDFEMSPGLQMSLDGTEQIIESQKLGQPYQIEDVLSMSQPPPSLQPLQALGVRTFLIVPLLAGNELIGSLNLGSQALTAFTEEQIEIAREVADPLAVAIRQARLHQQVQRHAEELEERVHERTTELRQMVNLMAGREVRMAELKQVIHQLRVQLEEAGLTPKADDPLKDHQGRQT